MGGRCPGPWYAATVRRRWSSLVYWFPLLYWVGLLAAFVALAHLGRLRPPAVDAVERELLSVFAAIRAPILDRVVPVVTVLGTLPGYTPVAGIIVALAHRHRPREALFAGLGIVGAGLYYLPLNRWFFTRARPTWFGDPSGYEGYSFPSGHALVTVAMGLVVVLALRRVGSRWLGWAIAGVLFYVLAIAFTRLYLQVHHPSDIVAGWLLGAAWVIGLSRWFDVSVAASASRLDRAPPPSPGRASPGRPSPGRPSARRRSARRPSARRNASS